jgi:ankyrin repeat protein
VSKKNKIIRLVTFSWDGFTALHLASINGNLEVVKSLLDAGASLNLLDDSGRTALHMAVNFANMDVAQLLIERGIDVDLHKDVDTPLSLAVRNGDPKMVRLLLDAGAMDMSYQSNNGRTLLHDSMYMQNEEIIRDIILRGANVNAVDMDGFSPLHEAVMCRNMDQILLLLNNGAKITTKTMEVGTLPPYFYLPMQCCPFIRTSYTYCKDLLFFRATRRSTGQ